MHLKGAVPGDWPLRLSMVAWVRMIMHILHRITAPASSAWTGVEFATAIVNHPNGARIKAQIWDTGKPTAAAALRFH